jgi:protocatechuate 3,4-dioxygenase beta subunit
MNTESNEEDHMNTRTHGIFVLVLIGVFSVTCAFGKDPFYIQKIKQWLNAQQTEDTLMTEKYPSEKNSVNKNTGSTALNKGIPDQRSLFQAERGSISGYVYEKSYSGVEIDTDDWTWNWDLQVSVPILGGRVGDTLQVPVRIENLDIQVSSFEMTMNLGDALIFDCLETDQSLVQEAEWTIYANTFGQQVRVAAAGALPISIYSEYDYDTTQDTLFFIRVIISETQFQFCPIVLKDMIFNTGDVEIELEDGGIYASPDSVVIIPAQGYVSVGAYNEFGKLAGSGILYFSDDGYYSIDNLLPDSYYLMIDSYEYGKIYYDQATGWQEATLVKVNPGQETSDINFLLVSTEAPAGKGVISGKVTDGNGFPVSDCRIYACTGESDYNYLSSAQTDEQGVYMIKGLSTGEYRILASYDGTDNYLNTWYPNLDNYSDATPVQVIEPDTVRGIDIVLNSGCIVTGQVLDPWGNPVGYGYEVVVYDNQYGYEKYTETDNRGKFEFNALTPGSYKIQVSDYYSDYAETWYENANCFENADEIVVTLDEPVLGLVVRLQQGSSITGTVYQANGIPVKTVDGMLELYDAEGYSVDMLQTGDDGRYIFTGLTAGQYKLYYESWSYGTWTMASEWYHDGLNYETADWIELQSGETASDIDIHLDWAGSISGCVSGPEGFLPDQSGEVIVYDQNQNVISSSDLYGGYYEIDGLRPGEYRLKFNYYGDENYYDLWYPHETRFEDSESITVQASKITTNINFSLAYACRIQGFITDDQGRRLTQDEYPTLTVTVLDAQTGHYVDDDEISFSGGYDFKLIPGTYKLYCTNHYSNLLGTQDSLVMSFYSTGILFSDPGSQEITVESNAVARLGDWVIEKTGGGISGTLYDKALGSAINDGFYGVILINEDSMMVKMSFYLELTGGVYSVLGLYPGKYCLLAFRAQSLFDDSLTLQWYPEITGTIEDLQDATLFRIPQNVTWITVSDTVEKGIDVYFTDISDTYVQKIALNPESFSLQQNYPNPFNPITHIQYTLAEPGLVELNLYNMLGQQVASLVYEKQEAGIHQVRWDGSGFPSGMYFYRIQSGDFCAVKKCLLVK